MPPRSPTSETFELPRTGGTAGASHLAVRIDGPRPGVTPRGMILYLHGFGASQAEEKASFFRTRATAGGYTFCSFDFQGHGGSGGEMAELSLSRNLGDAAAVHDELARRGFGRPVLLGSSMGGAAALWHAAARPEEVAAVVAIAPALGMRRRLAEWAGEEGLVAWRASGVRLYEDSRGAFPLGWGLMEDFAAYPVSELLTRYRTPALLFQGRGDESVDWRETVDFAAGCRFDEIELHLFSDGDHRLADRLDRLWHLMREFLKARLGT